MLTCLQKLTHWLPSPETSVNIRCVEFSPVTGVAAQTPLHRAGAPAEKKSLDLQSYGSITRTG